MWIDLLVWIHLMLKQNVDTIIFLCMPKATGRATRGGRAPLPFCEKQKKGPDFEKKKT